MVLALHAAAGWALLSREFTPMALPTAPDAVMLDLAPDRAPDLPPVQPAAVPAAEMAQPPAVAPVPVAEAPMPVAEPPPVELPPTPPVAAEAVLPVAPPPRPQAKPKPRPVERPVQRHVLPRVADETSQRVAPAPAPAQVQAAPVQTTLAQPSAPRPAPAAAAVTPSWRNDLLSRLQQAKRYPDLARSHGDQGVATVTFTMDRRGRVVSVSLVRSSNSALLDEEAVALVRRAEPLPSLPEEMPGSTITLTVPISFTLR